MQFDSETAKQYEWARYKTRGELLDLVLEVEERLRRLVRAVLRELVDVNGRTWDELISTSIRSEIARGIPTVASEELIDKAALGHLIIIAAKHLGELAEDRAAFAKDADVFRRWRNGLAHGHNPSDREKVEIASAIDRVRRHIRAQAEPLVLDAGAVHGSVVLWVDDRPENNYIERDILRALGITVIPVLGNDEAVAVMTQLLDAGEQVDLVISDIDRAGGESGLLLPERLREIGVSRPLIYYAMVRSPLGIPPNAHSIQDDPALLIANALTLLARRSG